uniref:(northern house mosquito) hypothetical protein n=1 Tax=Culex pipiens TaxID=7175 RepID=A0A8D8CE96_CULPI
MIGSMQALLLPWVVAAVNILASNVTGIDFIGLLLVLVTIVWEVLMGLLAKLVRVAVEEMGVIEMGLAVMAIGVDFVGVEVATKVGCCCCCGCWDVEATAGDLMRTLNLGFFEADSGVTGSFLRDLTGVFSLINSSI